MSDHVLSLSFGTAQIYRQVTLNLLAHMFKRKVVGTYQLQSLSELEVNFDLFYYREKLF